MCSCLKDGHSFCLQNHYLSALPSEIYIPNQELYIGPTVDLVIFARFLFSPGGQIREFKNLAKIIFMIGLLKKIENSLILNFVKSPKIRYSRKFKHKTFQIYSI